MPNLSRHWPVLAAALAAAVHPQPAYACGATPCAQVNEIQPPDASVGVPVNTEIRVLYFGVLSNEYFDPTCDLDLRPLRLLPSIGEPIYLTGTVLPRPEAQQAWVIAKHVEPLAANTSYAVQLLLGPGQDPCRCDGREWATVSSFTSGEAEDHEAPTFAGLDRVDYGERLQGSSPCGGDHDFISIDPELTPASDAAPASRYNVYVNGQIAKRYVEEVDPEQYSELFVDCGTTSLSLQTAIAPGASLEVRAVDLAGNESLPNTPITIDDAACDQRPVELPIGEPVGSAGTTSSAPSPSDTPPTVTPSPSSEPKSGCDLSRRAVTSQRGTLGSIAGAAAGLLLLVGRVATRKRSARGRGGPRRTPA